MQALNSMLRRGGLLYVFSQMLNVIISAMPQYIYYLHQQFLGILSGYLAPFVFAKIKDTMRL